MTQVQIVLICSVFAFGSIGNAFASDRCQSPTGRWSGSKAGIKLRFVFDANGSYTYSASEGNDPITEHTGKYKSSRTGNPTWPCRIVLTPDPSTVKTQNQPGLSQMRKLMLFDDTEREYRVDDNDKYRGTQGQPALQFKDIELGNSSSGQWSIER